MIRILLLIYNSRNYITLLGFLIVISILIIYNSRNYITLLGLFIFVTLLVYLQQQKLHYLIRHYTRYTFFRQIYNSRNYITLLGNYPHLRHDKIYNSRNYITLLGRDGYDEWRTIYNSRNYITLLGNGVDLLDELASTIVEITLPYQAAEVMHLQRLSTIVEITLPYQAKDEDMPVLLIYNSRNYITLLGVAALIITLIISTIVEITLPYQASSSTGISPSSTIVEITLPYQAYYEPESRRYLQQQKLHYLIRLNQFTP